MTVEQTTTNRMTENWRFTYWYSHGDSPEIDKTYELGSRVRVADFDEPTFTGRLVGLDISLVVVRDGSREEECVPWQAVELLKKCDSSFSVGGRILPCEEEGTNYHRHHAKYTTGVISW